MQEEKETQHGRVTILREEEKETIGHQTQQHERGQPGQAYEEHTVVTEYTCYSGEPGGVTGPTGFGHDTNGGGQENGHGTVAYESGDGAGVGYPSGGYRGYCSGGAGECGHRDYSSVDPFGVKYPSGGYTNYSRGAAGERERREYTSGDANNRGDYPSADPDAVIGGRGGRERVAGRDVPTADPNVVEERKRAAGHRMGGGGRGGAYR